MSNTSPALALLVEDDLVLRQMFAEALEDEEVDVIQCASAEAAELIIGRSGAELAVLITDVNLAGHGSGIELARFARYMFPGIKVVVISGQSVDDLPEDVAFLQKPFVAEELVKAALA